MKVLLIQSSARTQGSVTRELSTELVERLQSLVPSLQTTVRDLAEGVPLLTDAMIHAMGIPREDQSEEHRMALQASDAFIEELEQASLIVLAVPIYNFAVPAALKAYFDLVARARVTFRYAESGPVGLLTGKRAVVIAASGGTEAGSDIDFATGYVRHFLGFLGITSVELIAADRLMMAPARLEEARAAVGEVAKSLGQASRTGGSSPPVSGSGS